MEAGLTCKDTAGRGWWSFGGIRGRDGTGRELARGSGLADPGATPARSSTDLPRPRPLSARGPSSLLVVWAANAPIPSWRCPHRFGRECPTLCDNRHFRYVV